MLNFQFTHASEFSREFRIAPVRPVAIAQHVRGGPIVKGALPPAEPVTALHHIVGIHLARRRGRAENRGNVADPTE